MKELENGEYVLTMKEPDKVILNAIPVNGSHLAYRSGVEYKLIVKDNSYIIYDEQHPDGIEFLEMTSLDWFNIKKIASVAAFYYE